MLSFSHTNVDSQIIWVKKWFKIFLLHYIWKLQKSEKKIWPNFFQGGSDPLQKKFQSKFFSSLYLKLQKSEKNVDPIFFNEVRPPSEKNSKSKIFFASLYLNIAKKQKKIELIFFKRGPILMNKIKEIWEFCLMCVLYTTSR